MAKPTMADVARRAGVDVSTVSRALNERTARVLRPETVERVVRAATALGYRPNVLARGLRTQRSLTIGMVLPDLTNPFFPPIVRGAEAVLDAAGYTLILASTDHDPDRERRVLHSLLGRQVDGLLLAASRLDEPPGELSAPVPEGMPVVLLNRTGPPDMPTVVADDAGGVAAVVAHLRRLGHEQVGSVAGPQHTSTGRARLQGFREACEAAGSWHPGLVECAEVYWVEAGHRACARLLERLPDLTAVFAANDLLAVGCLRALRERGAAVPADVSVVGFNDMMLVDLIEPALTTVHVPQHEIGRQAALMMLRRLAGDPAAADAGGSPRMVLPATLVVRRSTGPAPARGARPGVPSVR